MLLVRNLLCADVHLYTLAIPGLNYRVDNHLWVTAVVYMKCCFLKNLKNMLLFSKHVSSAQQAKK